MRHKGRLTSGSATKARVAALAVGTMQLNLPSGFVMELDNCYYVPALSRNIISASCLMSQGYEFNLQDNGCSFSLNGMFHDYTPIVDGLFILNLEQEPVYNVNVKRHKPNEINATYLWHCRLGRVV